MDGAPIILQELEGQLRTLTLDGAAMAERGLEVGAKLRKIVNRYPGNDVPSVQVLGHEEDPIVIKGSLNDSLMGLAGYARATANAMRELFLGKRYVAFSWGDTLVRRGMIDELKLIWDRDSLARYELTLLPLEAQEAVVIAVPFPASEQPAAFLEAIEAALDELEDAADNAVAILNLGRALL